MLAKVPGLKVSARTSAFSFKGRQVPIPEIAEKLGVAYVVEGSVRKEGKRVRISAQLIEAADGFQVWSENFNRELKDIFALQDEIAGLIAEKLSLKLGVGAPAKTVDPEVFRLYLEGLQEWNRRSQSSLVKAEAAFEKALAIDPNFARAHAMLADVWYLQAGGAGFGSEQGMISSARAEERLTKSLALDPSLVDAYVTRGTLLHWKRMDAAADADFRRALTLNPNSALARQRYGVALCMRGKFPAGLAELELAVQLDPLAPINPTMLGLFLAYERRWEEALAANDRALAIDPDFGRARYQRTLCLIQLGRVTEARELLRERLNDSEMRTISSRVGVAVALARAGAPEATELAEPILARRSELNPRFVLQLYLALNRIEEAFVFLGQANLKFSSGVHFTDPLFDPIRDDPRFLRKLEEAGLLAEYREAWSHIPTAEKQRSAGARGR